MTIDRAMMAFAGCMVLGSLALSQIISIGLNLLLAVSRASAPQRCS
jgi:hypothetical protein